MSTAYYQSLPKAVQKRLDPLLPVMQRAASDNGIPVDLLISIAVRETGVQDVIGDKHMKMPAKGIYQVRDAGYWTGGVDPRNTEKATPELAKTLSKVYAGCNGDMACVHFKYVAGQNRKYDEATVNAVASKHSHIKPRLQHITDNFGGPAWLGGSSTTKRTPTLMQKELQLPTSPVGPEWQPMYDALMPPVPTPVSTTAAYDAPFDMAVQTAIAPVESGVPNFLGF